MPGTSAFPGCCKERRVWDDDPVMHPCAIAPDLVVLIGPSTVPALNKLENVIDRLHEVAFPPSRLLTWTAPRSVIPLALTSRRGGTDEFLGAGFSDPATLGLWSTTRGQTLHTCLVQLRADTVRWNFSGAAERERVNSIRGVTRTKKKTLHNSGVRLLTSEAIYELTGSAPDPDFSRVCD
jgi:hypothetical protein